VQGEPIAVMRCHCEDCRTAGAAKEYFHCAMFPADKVGSRNACGQGFLQPNCAPPASFRDLVGWCTLHRRCCRRKQRCQYANCYERPTVIWASVGGVGLREAV